MANNKAFNPSFRRAVVVTAPAAATSGAAVRWGQLTGVALTDVVAATGVATVDFGPSAWRLSVTDTVGGGIAVGDPLYLNDAATLLDNQPTTGRFFGYAEEAIGAGLTATICVWHEPNATVGTLNLQADVLAANAAGRAAMEADFFNAATVDDTFAVDSFTEANVLSKFAADSFSVANVLAIVEDEAIIQAKIAESSLTGYAPAVSAADAAIPAVPVLLRYDVPDMATGVLDFDLTYGVLVLDVWLKKVTNNASAHAHTIQVQTIGGAANISSAMSLNAVAQNTLVRTTTVDDAAVVAAANAVRIDVVRADGAGQVACEVYVLAVKV